MSNLNLIKDYLKEQICELEALQSVYPKELKLLDHGIVADINDFISNESDTELPSRLEYSVEIPNISERLEMQVILPADYPDIDPEIYVRSSALDRVEQVKLNQSLVSFLGTQEKGEPMIYSVISWLQDNAEEFLKSSIKKNGNKISTKLVEKKLIEFARYWVYSHHIYSKIKRREITDLARDCSLTGFCLAGKPGIVCIEGDVEDCDYWWQQVKVMNWHRIFVKYVEKDENLNGVINEQRKFNDFQEITFPTSDRHNDMGQLLKYLTEHNSQHVFKELFGMEGKSS